MNGEVEMASEIIMAKVNDCLNDGSGQLREFLRDVSLLQLVMTCASSWDRGRVENECLDFES